MFGIIPKRSVLLESMLIFKSIKEFAHNELLTVVKDDNFFYINFLNILCTIKELCGFQIIHLSVI